MIERNYEIGPLSGTVYFTWDRDGSEVIADEIVVVDGDTEYVTRRSHEGISGAIFRVLEEPLIQAFSDDPEISAMYQRAANAELRGVKLLQKELI